MTRRARRQRPGAMAASAKWHRGRAAHGDPDAAEHLAIAEELEHQLKTAGRCTRCGRGLSDPESVALGIGPDCRALVAKS